jgi:hypothetical protein
MIRKGSFGPAAGEHVRVRPWGGAIGSCSQAVDVNRTNFQPASCTARSKSFRNVPHASLPPPPTPVSVRVVFTRVPHCDGFLSDNGSSVSQWARLGVAKAAHANRSCTTTSDRASWPPFGRTGFTALPTAIMKPITWSLGRLMISATFTGSKPIIGQES